MQVKSAGMVTAHPTAGTYVLFVNCKFEQTISQGGVNYTGTRFIITDPGPLFILAAKAGLMIGEAIAAGIRIPLFILYLDN